MTKRFRIVGLAFVLIISLVLSACGENGGNNEGKGSSSGGNNNNAGNNSNGESVNIGKKDITLLGDNYNSATASMNVVKQLLEKIGYNVTIKEVGVGTMFAGIAEGSADASLACWLPTTHESYWEKYGDQLDKAGKVMKSVPLGFTVPKYMKDVHSIEDLKGNTELGEKLDWTLTGISPGAGEMLHAKKAIEAYELDKWNLQASSEAGMLSELTKAEKAKDPVIVTLWYPHWAFVKWDLKLLKDPKNIFGKPDDIYAVTRKGLKDDSPAAYKLLSQFQWTKEQDEKVMLKHQNGTGFEEAAKQFLDKHPDLEKKWLKGLPSS
jgi:glycine betaine/proline transport system substrate-binding protein